MSVSPIVPAIIPRSEAELLSVLSTLRGLPEIHVDVVDGKFVPAISWPYQPAGEPVTSKLALDAFSLEVDLMVQDPLLAASAWLEAGADQLVFHCETISVRAFARFAESTNISVGICAHMDTPHSTLEPYLQHADYIQVMGIAHIGSQGQPFDDRVFERVRWVQSLWSELPISIDGSVNAETLPKIIPHGIGRYIVGSAIVKQADPLQAYHSLTALWQSTADKTI